MALLDGKVILVTGAGNGIGRAHALALAREGARVVVNDLGGARDGSGGDDAASSRVVAEIEAAGGEAVANYDSVTDPDGCARMVRAALDRWGRLDGLVNNAGILRDRSFARMTPEEWQAVLDVHLNGTFHVTRAALPALLEAAAAHGGAAIVNTTSYSGLIGNFGQANYGAAKGGVYAFTRVLAVELRKKGITVNALAPIAKTRMTEELAHIEESWSPEQVSPVVVYLLSHLAREVTGRVFGVQGQRIHAYEMKTSPGVEKPGEEPWTPEEIARNLDGVFDFSERPATGDDPISRGIAALAAGAPAAALGDWKAVAHWVVRGGVDQTIEIGGGLCRCRPGRHGGASFTVKSSKEALASVFSGECSLASLVDSGRLSADDPTALARLVAALSTRGKNVPIGKRYECGCLLVENAEIDAFALATNDRSVVYYGPDAVAPPMFHARLLRDAMFAIIDDPELGLDFLHLMHAEHDAVFHRPLRPGDLVHARARLDHVEQKEKGLLVTGTLLGFVEGEAAVEARTTFFIRGQQDHPVGSTFGERPAAQEIEPPGRPPDFEIPWKVDADQSLRYADVSRDRNPLHLDPATARAAGLPDVVLHGLCTMAMAAHSIVKRMAFDDSRDLRRLFVRFRRPVHNGTALVTRCWRTAGGVVFTVVEPAGDAVVAGGMAVLAS